MKFLQFLLIPFEYLYYVVTSIRNYLYDKNIFKSKRFEGIKVVSVGNISVGGSGKTPLTIYLAKRLIENGKNVAIVSRGYKSKIKKGVHEIKEGDSSSLVGDEPYMIYKNLNSNNLKCKVIVSPKRTKGIGYIKDNYKDVDTVILDDGMQHRFVYRDVDILCIDVGSKKAREDFLSNRLLPRGFLRESVKQGVKRTDIAVLNYRSPYKDDICSKNDIEKIKKLIPVNIPISKCFINDISFFNYKYEPVDVKKNIIVFCAIAKPINFFNTLESFRHSIVKKYIFPDHQAISNKKLEQIFNEAKTKNLNIVCTEKDFVKLSDKWQKECFFAKINICFDDENILKIFLI